MPSEQEPHISAQETERGAFVFFSYARRDKWLRDELEKHLSNLKYRGLITTWHDQEIRAGEEWAQQVDIYLNKAHIILLLISADFMASEYCYGKEMKHALERNAQREADVIPILLRPVLFTDAPFAKLQMLPANGMPITEWQNQDSAFLDIANGIERVALKYPFNPLPTEEFTRFSEFSMDIPTITTIIRRSLFSRFPLGIFIVGIIATGILALLMPSNIILLVVVFSLSLLAAGSIAALKAVKVVRFLQPEKIVHGLWLKYPEESESHHWYYEYMVKFYRFALSRDPFDGDAFRGMGNALYALKRYDEAVYAFQQAVNHNPTASAYAGLAGVFAKLQRYRQAVATYKKAIKLDPTVTFNYDDLIQSLLVLGRKEEAEQARASAKQFGYYQDDDR